MSKILYFVFLLSLPLVTIIFVSRANAQTNPGRRGVVCGQIFKAETRLVKSMPVTYLVTNKGHAYALYPYLETGAAAAAVELSYAILASLQYLDITCLEGVLYSDVFVPRAVVPNPEQNARAEGRPPSRKSRRDRRSSPPAEAPAPQVARPARTVAAPPTPAPAQPQRTAQTQNRRMDWVPWSKTAQGSGN